VARRFEPAVGESSPEIPGSRGGGATFGSEYQRANRLTNLARDA